MKKKRGNKRSQMSNDIKRILHNQQIIYDLINLIIYNQYPHRKKTFVVKEDTLKQIEKKYNL